jgi:hypothetical protein
VTGGDVKVDTGFQQLSFPIRRGILKAHDNVVTLFVDI